MLTVKQAAERAGVSFGLVYEWTRSGMLPHYRMGRSGARGGIRIADVDLDAFLQSRHIEGPVNVPVPVPRQKLKLHHLQMPS